MDASSQGLSVQASKTADPGNAWSPRSVTGYKSKKKTVHRCTSSRTVDCYVTVCITGSTFVFRVSFRLVLHVSPAVFLCYVIAHTMYKATLGYACKSVIVSRQLIEDKSVKKKKNMRIVILISNCGVAIWVSKCL